MNLIFVPVAATCSKPLETVPSSKIRSGSSVGGGSICVQSLPSQRMNERPPSVWTTATSASSGSSPPGLVCNQPTTMPSTSNHLSLPTMAATFCEDEVDNVVGIAHEDGLFPTVVLEPDVHFLPLISHVDHADQEIVHAFDVHIVVHVCFWVIALDIGSSCVCDSPQLLLDCHENLMPISVSIASHAESTFLRGVRGGIPSWRRAAAYVEIWNRRPLSSIRMRWRMTSRRYASMSSGLSSTKPLTT